MNTFLEYETHFQKEKLTPERRNRIENIRINASLAEKNISIIIDRIAEILEYYKLLGTVIDLMEEIDRQVDDFQQEADDIEKLSNRDDVYDSYHLDYLRERLG